MDMELNPKGPASSIGVRVRVGVMILALSMSAACSSGSGNGGGSSNDAVAPPPRPVVTTFVPFVALQPIRAGEFRYSDEARVTVDGRPAALEDLHDGEVAMIRGTRLYSDSRLDGVGIESIDVHHLVIGPVESVEVDRARLSVMGQDVSVTGDTIVDDALVSHGGLGALQPGDTVAVSGFFAASGQIIATRISRRAADSAVLLRGTIYASNPATSTFRFRASGFDVYYGQADIDLRDFPSGVPQDGDMVLLRSRSAPDHREMLDADSVAFVPHKIQAAVDTEVELMGAITWYESSEIFDVAGLRVHANCAPSACGPNWQLARENALVTVVGKADAYGAVQARYAWLADDGPFDLTAPVEAIDPEAQAFTLLGFQVQSSVFTRFAAAQVGGPSAASVEDLRVGDIVTASGTYGGVPGLLVASRINRIPARDPYILVRGQFERANPAIIVLGRSILTESSTTVDQCGSPVGPQRLFSDTGFNILTIGLQAPATDQLKATFISMYSYAACE
jgi:hypothetical protein